MEYVPLWYATCYESLSAPLEPSAVLDLMTPRASQVLRTKVATTRYWWERTTPCAILDTREAWAIFDEFGKLGIPKGGIGQASVKQFTLGSEMTRVRVTFFPLMPNGQTVLHGD